MFNMTSETILFVLVSYLISCILAIIFPFGIIFLPFSIYIISPILSLRFAVISFTALVNNQYTLIGLAHKVDTYSFQIAYIAGFLFYFVVFVLFSKVLRPKLSKSLLFLIILFTISFIKSFPNFSRAAIIFFNVMGGFLSLFLILNSSLKKKGKYYLEILLKDFFALTIIITFLSILVVIIDLPFNLWFLKFHAKYLDLYRGEHNNFLMNIANAYITSVGPIENWIRYTPLLNDPIRSAYWYLYILYFIYFYIRPNIQNLFPKLLMLFISLSFLLVCLSKGALSLLVYTMLFAFLFKRGMYKISLLLFLVILLFSIVLSTVIKSSAAIHVMGLLLPFKQNLDLRYFIGNKLALAGNMGRIPGESWIEAVERGAESLVGTYMYSVGLVGVLLYLKIHWNTIKLKLKERKYPLAALLTGSLIITFLQEGHYNIMQVFPLLMVSLLLDFKRRSYESDYGIYKTPNTKIIC